MGDDRAGSRARQTTPVSGGSIAEAVGRAVGCVPGTAAGGGRDAWPAVTVAQIQRHSVWPLLQAAGSTSLSGLDDDAAAGLVRDALSTLRATARALALQRELVTRLEESELPVLVLKGPSVAVRAHGDVARRHSGDVDLLVDPGDVARVVTVLGAAGFQPGLELTAREAWGHAVPAVVAAPQRYPAFKAITLTRGTGDHVELHWRLFPNGHLLPVRSAWLTAPDRMDLAGSSTPVLPLAVLWRYLLVHGVASRWVRLKWLADIPALALRHPELVSPPALEAVAQEGLGRCVASGLLVAERVFGHFLPDHARSWAGGFRGTRTLTRSSMAMLRGPGAPETFPPADLPRYVAEQLLLRDGGRYRRAEARRLLLHAGRLQVEADPGLLLLARAPGRWVTRVVTSSRSRPRA